MFFLLMKGTFYEIHVNFEEMTGVPFLFIEEWVNIPELATHKPLTTWTCMQLHAGELQP